MADLGAAGDTSDLLEQEFSRMGAAATGEKPGIVSVQYVSEAVKALKQAMEAADSDAKDNPMAGGAIAKLAYTAAAYRDAQYGCRGRKFLRIAGINVKNSSLYSRAQVLEQAAGSIE